MRTASFRSVDAMRLGTRLGRGGAVPTLAAILIGVTLASAFLGVSSLLGARPVAGIAAGSGAPARAVPRASCDPSPGASCGILDAGSSWSVGPMSTWCTSNTTYSPGPNGSYSTTVSYCTPSVGWVLFNMTENATLSGAFSAEGPFGVWLFPQGLECDLLYGLAHIAVPCPPPLGSFPSHPWNGTAPTGGSVNLTDPVGGPGTIPPGLWELAIINTGSVPETISVTQAIALTLV